MPISEIEKKIRAHFISNLSIGIASPESNNNYNAQNPEGSATGKYQFTSWWLNKGGKNGEFSIQSFAKNSEGLFSIPEDMEAFKKDRLLQDTYFRYYAEKVLYPLAKKAYQGDNPANLSIEEMGALYHYKPQKDDKYGNTGATKQIETGVFDEATVKGKNGAKYTNSSSLNYISKVSKSIKESGSQYISKEELIDGGVEKSITKEKIIADFKRQEDIIDNNKYTTPEEKERQREVLFQNAVDSGYVDILNENWKSENDKMREDNIDNIKKYNDLKDFIENDVVFDYTSTKGDVKAKFNKESTYQNADSNSTEQREALRKLYPEIFTNSSRQFSGGDSVLFTEKLLEEFKAQHLALTGEVINITPGSAGDNKDRVNVLGGKEGVNITVKKGSDGGVGIISPYLLSGTKYRDKRSGSLQLGLSNLDQSTIKNKEHQIIDKEHFKPTPREEKIKEKEEKQKEEKKKVDKKEEKTDESNKGLTKEWFDNELALNSLDSQEFNYTPGKRELPIDSLMGIGMAMAGNKQVDEAKIPLRTEEISNAMRNYTAELMQRSKEGLPVEVEAQMKGLIADAYQGGLLNIVSASGGNSATVLGNLGSLEQAKTKGLIGIQVADYEAKDRAFAQYGKAIEYINDFDTRRDIANHAIKYGEAKLEQKEGKALATAGMEKLMEGIKYQKENGPGSANDMYRSLLMQKMFGFDPKAKDDGTGIEVGTKSWYDAQKQIVSDKFKVKQGIFDRYQNLSPDKKLVFDNVFDQNKDMKVANGMLTQLENNDADPNKMDMNQLGTAIKENNYGLITNRTNNLVSPTAMKTDIRNITTPQQELNITEEKLNGLIPAVPEPIEDVTKEMYTPKGVGLAQKAIGIFDSQYEQ